MQDRIYTAVILQCISALLRRSLRAWLQSSLFAQLWRVVWQRVSLRTRRCALNAWRILKDGAVSNRRVARKEHQMQLGKTRSRAWRGWVHMCEKRSVTRQRREAAQACWMRSKRVNLLGILGEWKGHVDWMSTDQRIEALSGAVESYEQALKEVGDEKNSLEVEKQKLDRLVGGMNTQMQQREIAREELLAEFESKFTTLQANYVRSDAACHAWKSKLEEEQYLSHAMLAAAQEREEQMKMECTAAITTHNHLEEEVAAKNTVIDTLQQRVHDLLAEISFAGEYVQHNCRVCVATLWNTVQHTIHVTYT